MQEDFQDPEKAQKGSFRVAETASCHHLKVMFFFNVFCVWLYHEEMIVYENYQGLTFTNMS